MELSNTVRKILDSVNIVGKMRDEEGCMLELLQDDYDPEEQDMWMDRLGLNDDPPILEITGIPDIQPQNIPANYHLDAGVSYSHNQEYLQNSITYASGGNSHTHTIPRGFGSSGIEPVYSQEYLRTARDHDHQYQQNTIQRGNSRIKPVRTIEQSIDGDSFRQVEYFEAFDHQFDTYNDAYDYVQGKDTSSDTVQGDINTDFVRLYEDVIRLLYQMHQDIPQDMALNNINGFLNDKVSQGVIDNFDFMTSPDTFDYVLRFRKGVYAIMWNLDMHLITMRR